MARRVTDFAGLTLQSGRRYILNYETVDTSVVPFGVPSETALGAEIARIGGVTLEGTARGPFSDTVGVRIIWEGSDLVTPGEAFPARLQLPAEIAGSATVELSSVDVGQVVREDTRERAREREGDVATQPGETQVPALAGKLLSPAVLVVLALAFVFTGAGQTLVESIVGDS